MRDELAGLREQLHQPNRVCAGYGQRIELRFLPDQRSDKIRIELFADRKALQIGPVGRGKSASQYSRGSMEYRLRNSSEPSAS